MSLLAAEHSHILKDSLPQILELRREHPASDDVIVIVDCVAFPALAARLGMLHIARKVAEQSFVLAVGSAKLEHCKKAFPSHVYPTVAKALQVGVLVPTAYRVIVVTERGASSAQCMHAPEKDARS